MIPTHIKEEERKVFKDTLDKIVDDVAPEKIICFGSRSEYSESWSNFLPDGNMRYFTYYDLLVITMHDDERGEFEILEEIYKHNDERIHITALVYGWEDVYTAVREGDWFFVTICHKGTVVYDLELNPFDAPTVRFDEHKFAIKQEEDWNQSFGVAKRFHKTAEVSIVSDTDQLHDVTVLMLYRAAEHACRAIIKYYTGYQAEGYNLTGLLWLVRNFSFEVTTIFPRVTKEESALFDLLSSASNVERNKHDYTVSGEIARTLLERVRSLIEAIEKLYQDKRKLAEQ